MINRVFEKIKSLLKNKDKLKSKFTEIHDKNLFFGKESVSGTGSDLVQTKIISKEIPILLKKYSVKTFIDAPCGDFFWMQHVDFETINYIGLDIVDELVFKNNTQFGNVNRKFICKNIVTDKLPDGDIIMIRDCWVHLSYADTANCITNLKKSNIKYLLITSFPEVKLNEDLFRIWRPLNLELAPFYFSKPLVVINEGCTENGGIYKDKSLMLWEIAGLPDIKL